MADSALLEHLKWRYAAKKMDPSKPVSQGKLDVILEAVRKAPTSSGTQPFEVLLVTNPEVKADIRKVAWDQSPVTEGSHLLVFAAWDNYTAERIDAVLAQLVEERGDLPLLNQYYENLKATYLPRDAQVNHEHAARQAYIALGFAMIAAAEQGIDCTPMEGFVPAKVDEILGLREKGLKSVVLLPLGHRDASGDWLLQMPKSRKALEAIVTEVK
ncbi:NAD(P)H-dependent oxidoreductase [Planktotalea sp.]|uniref:NAD(P)H-dependent oxidoreductase n=1 Tax=Planktotalea sp. TaxID=2029877 RepID=UPI00329A5EA7